MKFFRHSSILFPLLKTKKGVKIAVDKIRYITTVKETEEFKTAFFKNGPTKENNKAAVNVHLAPFSLTKEAKGSKNLTSFSNFNK